MIDRLFKFFGYERRATLIGGGHPRDPAIADFYGLPDPATGVNVTEATALNFSAVFRAVQLISGCVSTLPLHVYERGGNDLRKRAEHPLEALLNEEPNEEMDASTFRETLQGHVLTWGNGYAEVERSNAGDPIALHPLSPDRVKPRRVNKVLVYEVTGKREPLAADDVLHISGLGFDGLVGYSPIRIARQSIGLGMAAEEFGARFFGSGTHLGGIISRPPNMPWKTDAADRFKKDFREWHEGVGKSHKLAVLEDGMTFSRLGIPPNDAQFLETRKFQITEIARWYGIPPHLLYDLDKATFSNIEHQGIEFLTYSLRYWLKKWERAIKRTLIAKEDRQRYYVEHRTEDLVRADITTRYTAYATGRSGGWLSINDIRRKENETPVEGGDAYLQPLNMADIKTPTPTQPATEKPTPPTQAA